MLPVNPSRSSRLLSRVHRVEELRTGMAVQLHAAASIFCVRFRYIFLCAPQLMHEASWGHSPVLKPNWHLS